MDNNINNQDNAPIIEKVSLSEIEQISIPEQIDLFFEEKKQDELTKALNNIEGNDYDFYPQLSKEYEELKGKGDDLTRILGSILDFVEFVKENGGDKLYLDYRDFEVVSKFLNIAVVEYKNGEIPQNELEMVVLMFSNYIRGILLSCSTLSNIEEYNNIEKIVNYIITTGNLELLNIIKRV